MFAVSPSSKELDLHATPMKINVQDITLCNGAQSVLQGQCLILQ